MENIANLTAWVVWGGLVLAFIFGLVASKTNFCTMGAISDVVNMEHWGRMRMWMLAIGVAVLGSSLLGYLGLVDLGKSIYQRPSLPWLSLIVGGALFGVGMTMAGGCANRNLIRVGAGSVRSLVVLTFMGISAYMTLKGLFGQWRASFLDPMTIDLAAMGMGSQSLGEVLSKLSGLGAKPALLAMGVVVFLATAVFALKDKRFRGNPNQLIGGIVLGLIIVAAWYLSGHIGFLAEDPETLEAAYYGTNTRTIESLSFVAPTAYSLELLMLWTDKSMHVTFGIASAIGVVLGSLAWALLNKSFRWEGFANLEDLRNQLIGAVLMGFGGVTAMGCTVGQGMTGVSTLAIGSFIALASIIAGSVGMMKWQLRD
ncbi:MAG: YeeE/YedE family protein [Hylemonella sp.]|nr:YeeE/YedE family protein [Hylemonella sp.]